MIELPAKLSRLLAEFEAQPDRRRRAEMLIDLADRFEGPPPSVATRPFPEENHVLGCESDAYVWAEDQPDGALKFHVAVENPQAISAKALAVIVADTLSGATPEQVVAVPTDVVFRFFGRDVSRGKGQDLVGIMSKVRAAAREGLGKAAAPA